MSKAHISHVVRNRSFYARCALLYTLNRSVASQVLIVLLLLKTHVVYGQHVHGSDVAVQSSNAIVSKIISHLTAQESTLDTMVFDQSEFILTPESAAGVILRTHHLEQSKTKYRLSVTYPDLPYPPPQKNDGSGLLPYIPTEVAWNGDSLKAYVAPSKQGFVDPPKEVGPIFGTYPLTNYQPFFQNKKKRLTEYLVEQSTNPDVVLHATLVADSTRIVVEINNGAEVTQLNFDTEVGYNLISLEVKSATDGHIIDSTVFADYRKEGSAWVAWTASYEQAPIPEIGFVGRNNQYRIVHLITNEHIEDAQFEMTFPLGSHITDYAQGLRFRIPSDIDTDLGGIDEQLQSVSIDPTGDLARNRNISKAASSPTNKGVAADRSMTDDEAIHSYRFSDTYFFPSRLAILVFGGGCLGVGLFVLAIRRRYSGRAVATLGMTGRLPDLIVGLCMIVGASAIAGSAYYWIAYDNGAFLELSQGTINLGTIVSDRPQNIEIEIRNIGSSVLNITGVQRSCSCTAAYVDRLNLQAGESMLLHITYSPKPNASGPFSSMVIIQTNSEESPNPAVNISGRSESCVIVRPQIVHMGSVNSLSKTKATFELIGPKNQTVTVGIIGDESGGVRLIDTEVIANKSDRTTYRVNVEVDGIKLKAGPWRQDVRFTTECPLCPEFVATFSANIVKTILFEPAILIMNDVESGEEVSTMQVKGIAATQIDYLAIEVSPDVLDAEIGPALGDPFTAVLSLTPKLSDLRAAGKILGEIKLVTIDRGQKTTVAKVPFQINPRR